MDLYEKWFNNYIDNVDLSKIEWVKFDVNELDVFYQENYLDKDVWQYAYSQTNSSIVSPFGLHYLSFSNFSDGYSFLLGMVSNNIGKKTIVAAMVYFENYYVFEDQYIPLTYISTVETNSFFWNKGLYKKMCEVLINFINPQQHILVSGESNLGRKYCVVKKLRDGLLNNGFDKLVMVDDDSDYMKNDFYNIVCGKKRVLK